MIDTCLSSWVIVALPGGGTVTVYGEPEAWPVWVWGMAGLDGEKIGGNGDKGATS